jgi:hypothetical protein
VVDPSSIVTQLLVENLSDPLEVGRPPFVSRNEFDHQPSLPPRRSGSE